MRDAIINRRDLAFQVFELLKAEELTARPRHADHNRETFLAALDTALAIAAEKFATHNRRSDEHEPRLEAGRVRIIPEVKEALDAYRAAGLIAASQDYDLGGMQLPVLLSQACASLFKSANVATSSYVGLTLANANVIRNFGAPAQKRKYLKALLNGRFFGTMAMTEPHAGSSISDLSTSATLQPDGSYRIRGQKIFISAGDHDLSENIVHLLLARIPGSPPGAKGISLFTVPKHRVNADGTLGCPNDVALAGLIHKMGCRGTTSTILSFGEQDACEGEIVGEPNRGLSYMFHMMNEARIGVGLNAVMLGYRGYLSSLDYARERRQGRRAGHRDPMTPQVPLIAHADVRRMLLAQKAYVEGGYALCLYAARLVDDQATGETESMRVEAAALLELLTPVVKAWPSQWCLEANSLAIQTLGGYGYTREYPVEQFYRDNRLNMIHEGTNGIQALDLLGRKVMANRGNALAVLEREMHAAIRAAAETESLRAHAAVLDGAWIEMSATISRIRDVMLSDGEGALANASVFLEAFGHTVVAWLWLRQALVATAALPTALDPAEVGFYHGKLHTCRWFFDCELPRTHAQHALLRRADNTSLGMAAGWY